ncbi:MAG: AraC family transcriptional regulator ligand-binding domain-containing protein [Gammaproteobacteria bacterium]
MSATAIEDLLMPATYGRHLARLFGAEAVLAGTGLTAADLEGPESRISVREALTYIRNTLRLGSPADWYLPWAQGLADHFHGPLSIALVSAPTLGDGLDAFVRYFPSRIPYMHMQGRQRGTSFAVEMTPLIELGACEPMLVETPLILLQRHLETVYAVERGAMRLELAYPATAYAAGYARHFGCEVRFETGPSALLLPLAWRATPNLDFIETSWNHACQQCDAIMASSRERETLGAIRSLLAAWLEAPVRTRPAPTLDHVAAVLHVTPRTLIRRLRRLGTHYQALTDDMLRARAQELLGNDELTIKEVAGRLGFDNPANFGKAFKRWCGVSPGRYRMGEERRARSR